MKRVLFLLVVLAIVVPSVLVHSVLAADSKTFYAYANDGDIVAWGTTYASVHEQHDLNTANFEDSDNVTTYWNSQNYLRTELHYSAFKVGQQKDGTLYAIWRGILPFNTSGLPKDITVSSISIFVMPVAALTGDTFDVDVLPTGDISYPALPTDFDVIGTWGVGIPSQPVYATHDAASLVAATFEEFVFNATGIAQFQTGISNLMSFSIVSGSDISGTDPTAGGASPYESISFYSAESQYAPYMVVTYTVNELGNPDTMKIANVAIFSDYTDNGGQLYCFTTEVGYQNVPDYFLPQEYFVVQLLNGGAVMAQVSLQKWGLAPLSIYLGPGSALVWGGVYTLRIGGTSAFAIPPAPVDYTIAASDWKGALYGIMDAWIKTVAEQVGISDANNKNAYLTSLSGKTIVNDAGTEIFTKGIPYINTKRLEMFSLTASGEQEEVVVTGAYSGLLYGLWDAYWTDKFDAIMNPIGGLPGYLFPTFLFFGLALGAVAWMKKGRPGKQTLGYLVALTIICAGLLFGIPIWIAMIGCTISILMLGRQIFLREM